MGGDVWRRIRIPLAAVLVTVAAFLAGHAVRGHALTPPFGGKGDVGFTVSDVDPKSQNAIVFVRDANRGYAFELRLDGRYSHYTYFCKVFTGGYRTPQEVQDVMDRARWWSERQPEGELTPFRARERDMVGYEPDPTVEEEKRAVANERVQMQADLQELKDLREWRDRVLALNPGLRQN
jgi:hypothetical protein